MTASTKRRPVSGRMRPRTRAWIVRMGAAPLAVALGALAALNPIMALVAVAAIGLVGVCLSRGDIAVAAFAATTYFEVLGSSALTPVKLVGGALVLSGALVLLVPSRRRDLPTWQRHPWLIGCSLALVIWAMASVSWAVDLAQVKTNGTRLLMDVLVLFTVPLLLRHVRDLRILGWWIVAASLGGAAAGAVLGKGFGGRAVGMFSDPNEFATATVVGAAFAIALGESSNSRMERWISRVAACGCLTAVVASASRSGVAAAVVAFVVLLITARGAERVRLVGILSIAVAIVACWLMLSPSGSVVEERLSSEGSTGREDLWRVARYQFQDEPLHGVGLGNYPVVSIRYLRRDVANLDLFIRMPRTVHNPPLELLAELGIVGFAAFYGIVGGCLAAIVRALRLARRARDQHLVGVIRGILAGLAALLAASVTLSALYVELQWILFGACIAAASIARGRAFQVESSEHLVSAPDLALIEDDAREPEAIYDGVQPKTAHG